MRSRLAQDLLLYIQKEGWVSPGDRVCVAVSGGADSVALLLLLLELRERLGVVLSVAHFNHLLRGRAADADEKFVARLAAAHDLPFHLRRADVAAEAKRARGNVEETARRLRYEFFEHLVRDGAAQAVAVAHTADDQAETVLGHLLRGTGLAGLGGIHPAVDHVFRPLLGVRREHLRAYLKKCRHPWREDVTNRDLTRMRARIRRRLLPLLEKDFHPAVAGHLTALAAHAREDEALLAALAEERVAALGKKDRSGVRIRAADLLRPWGKEGQPARALSKRMLKRMVESVKTRPGQLTARHLEAALDLAGPGHSGKTLPLPGGTEILRDLDDLVIRARTGNLGTGGPKTTSEEKPPAPGYEHPLRLGEKGVTFRVPVLGCAFRLMVIDWPAKRRETREQGAVVLDRDRLDGPLALRYCRPGDRFQPAGRRQPHKLKRLLLDKRVSRWERGVWPVLTSGGAIAWVRGLPVAAQFAPDARTRKGVVITEEKL